MKVRENNYPLKLVHSGEITHQIWSWEKYYPYQVFLIFLVFLFLGVMYGDCS